MNKTIFMVDDHVSNLARAEELLEEHYLVITLSSAEAMFAVLEKVVPDLILLDIDMPEMNGLEAIKLLKANSKFSEIPIIFLTGLTDSDTEAYGIELGAVDFITKPFSEPVLLNRIKTHLHIHDLIQERTEVLECRKSALIHTLADSQTAIHTLVENAGDSLEPQMADALTGIVSHLETARDEVEKI
jgi:putative two-component system response regulator